MSDKFWGSSSPGLDDLLIWAVVSKAQLKEADDHFDWKIPEGKWAVVFLTFPISNNQNLSADLTIYSVDAIASLSNAELVIDMYGNNFCLFEKFTVIARTLPKATPELDKAFDTINELLRAALLHKYLVRSLLSFTDVETRVHLPLQDPQLVRIQPSLG